MTSTSGSFLDSADEVIFASDPSKWHTRYLKQIQRAVSGPVWFQTFSRSPYHIKKNLTIL